MGLVVTAISHVKSIRHVLAKGKNCRNPKHFCVRDQQFPYAQDVVVGCHEQTKVSQKYVFDVGSYSYYNEWRIDLSKLTLGSTAKEIWSNPSAYAGQSFLELIYFTDCDGVIGPAVSAKLYDDFVKYFAPMRKHWRRDYSSLLLYEDFQRGFKLGAAEGLVIFG